MSGFIRVEGTLSSRLNDELMLLAGDTYYALDATGARIWERLASPADETTLVADLVAAFDVDKASAEADVRRFLTDLESAGLIRPA